MFGTLLLIAIVAFVIYGTFFYHGDPYEIVWAPQSRQASRQPCRSAPIISAAVS